MCQQRPSRTLLEACSVALPPSPNVSEIDQETIAVAVKASVEITIDDEDYETDCDETDTKSSLSQPLAPQKSFPVFPSKSSRRKSKKSNKKSVRFDQAVTCRPSLHRKNYSQEEAQNSFYSRNEFENIRRDLLQTLALIHSGKFIEQDDDSSVSTDLSVSTCSGSGSSRSLHQPSPGSSSRGLENFTVKGSLKPSIKKLRQKSISYVLVEQDFQVEQAESMELTYLFYDEKAIRDSYIKFSKISSETALKRGQEDYEIATGRAPAPKKTTQRQSIRSFFSKNAASETDLQKKQQKQPRQRRWSLNESNRKNKIGISEKKNGMRRWSLKSAKQSSPASLIAWGNCEYNRTVLATNNRNWSLNFHLQKTITRLPIEQLDLSTLFLPFYIDHDPKACHGLL